MEVERYYLLGRQDAVQAKLDEVQNLQKSARALRERVRQLIEVMDEDHGKAIRVFTIVTVLFLPMYVPRTGHSYSKDSILRKLTMPQDLRLWLLWYEHSRHSRYRSQPVSLLDYRGPRHRRRTGLCTCLWL